MPTIRELLPSAIICVDEREVEDYRSYVPDENLLAHPEFDGLPAIRNWIVDTIKTDAVVLIDDDLTCVRCTTGSKRAVTDSEEILAIIENGLIACSDLDLGVFCFSRTTNTTIIRPDVRPIVPVQQVFSAFGVMNRARHRKWRTDLHGRADVDYTMQTLLDDRCLYADIRYYFDFGRIYSGRGGAVGLISTSDFLEASKRLKDRWGKHINYGGRGFQKSDSSLHCGINVSRTNPSAQT